MPPLRILQRTRAEDADFWGSIHSLQAQLSRNELSVSGPSSRPDDSFGAVTIAISGNEALLAELEEGSQQSVHRNHERSNCGVVSQSEGVRWFEVLFRSRWRSL